MAPATRHMCMIYDGSPTKQLSLLIPLMLDRLATRHRCMYFGNPGMVARLRAALAQAGLSVSEAVQKKSLILVSDQNHLKDGEFDSEAMLKQLADAVDEAIRDGYRGLWATGDMTWEFGSEKNLTKLLSYERGLEDVFRQKPALNGICQYHKNTLPLRSLGDALLTHQELYLNNTRHLNRFYIPTEELVDPDSPLQERDVEWMLSHFDIA